MIRVPSRAVPHLAVLIALAATAHLPACTGAPPAAPAAAAPQAASLSGRADLGGQPFAGAEVTVYRLAGGAVVAQSRSGDDGRFQVALGDTAPVKVVLTRGAERLVAVGAPAAPAAYAVAQAPDALLVDLATTLAYLLIAPKLEAAAQGPNTPTDTILAAYRRLAASAANDGARLAPMAAALTAALAPDGTGRLDAATSQRLASELPALVEAFRQAGEALNQAIAIAGSPVTGDAITFGGVTVPAAAAPTPMPTPAEATPAPTPTQAPARSGRRSSGGTSPTGPTETEAPPSETGTSGLTGNLDVPVSAP